MPGRGDPALGRVAVVGLGVMGGSLARALSDTSDAVVAGWSPQASEREAARAAGAVGRAPEELPATLDDADLVVLAAPLEATCALLATVAAHAPAHAVVTDVASLKVPVRSAAAAAGLSGRWVGSHPLTGSEAAGFSAGRSDLYRGARVFLVAGDEEPTARVRALWETVGARVEPVDAADHDALMARVSHLPQLAANALAAVLDEAGIPAEALGPGGRDMTRLAASSPAMWRDLVVHAPEALVPALRSLQAVLAEVADRVEAGDVDALHDLMARTRAWKTRP